MDHDNCPKCKSDNVSFSEIDIHDSSYGAYEASCLDCGFEGRQWYVMRFDCWQELGDNGQYSDIK